MSHEVPPYSSTRLTAQLGLVLTIMLAGILEDMVKQIDRIFVRGDNEAFAPGFKIVSDAPFEEAHA